MGQSSTTIRHRTGVILLIMGVLLVSLLVRMPTQGAATAQMAPCLNQAAGGFVFALAGYRANGDGSYTLTWQVTNTGKHDISYVAFGAGSWTRVAPQSGSIHTGELGDYQVEWTNDRGQPGFASVKYETQFAGFSQGSTETFTLVVGDFDPTIPIQVQAKAGRTVGAVTFTLAEEPTCDRTPPTPTPTTPFSPLPTPTATPEGYALPADPVVPPCLFGPPPGDIPAEPIIPLDAYTFAEPQLVLTNTAPIGIQQWLPDSETLLVTRHTGRGSSADLINARTGEIMRLVGPDQSFKAPRWLPQDRTLVWGASRTPNREPGYWVYSLNPPAEKRLADDWGSKHDVSPNGKEFIFLSPLGGTQPLIWNQETKTLRALPADLATWRYQNGLIYPFQPFNVNWHPGGEQILFWDGTWVFLYDLTTNTGCEIDIGALIPSHSPFTFIQEASWSPNGRYLLLKNAEYPPYTMHHGPHDLVLILDIYTGEAVQHSFGFPVWNFSWSPDGQTLAMMGKTGEGSDHFGRFNIYSLHLFNVRSGEVRQILPGHEGGGLTKIVWSPDATHLAFLGILPQGEELGDNVGGVLVSRVTMSR